MTPSFGSYKNKRKTGEARRSQVVSTYGVGALVDYPRVSGIMMGLDKWELSEGMIVHEKNLEEMLGKKQFIQPVKSDQKYGEYGLPMARFPNIYYCAKCKMLGNYRDIGHVDKGSKSKSAKAITCNACGPKVNLIPSRFVVSCINGHLQDFPYAWWVHRNHGGLCQKNPPLKINYEGKTGGLDSIVIHCENCGARSSMQGSMNEKALKGLKCRGAMPWIDKNYQDPEKCDATLRTMQRSANNVHYALTASALTIPPWSNVAQEAINYHYDAISVIFALYDDPEELKSSIKKGIYDKRMIEEEYNCTFDNFINEVFKRFADEDGSRPTEDTLLFDEYKAFSMQDVDDPYFKTTNEPVRMLFNPLIKQVKLVKRLREVQVLLGFRRIFPDYSSEREGASTREYVSISKQPKDWLPAVELFGEGIFIRFDKEKIEEWRTRIGNRYNSMAQNSKLFKIHEIKDIPAYVLLHTFSHLLIRQLSFQSGYATASLKEKIYCNLEEEEDKKMAGILIYTASPDSDGSLGGLVREGIELRLENTIRAMLEQSSWCSNDPICIDSMAQGYNSLNYAACHACALLPETSCESMNCFLDRASITGTPDNKELSFFKDLI